MYKKQKIMLFTLCMVLLLVSQAAGAAETKLTIVHLNDLHGFVAPLAYEGEVRGGAGRIMEVVDEIRSTTPNTLLLSAGDSITGSGDKYRLEWDQPAIGYRGLVEMKVLNAMGFDAMTLGNHEFDHGKRWLSKLMAMADFPLLSANIIHQDLPPVHGDRSGSLIAKPYHIMEFGDLRVAVVGLTTHKYMQSSQARVIDHKKVFEELLPELREKSDLIVVLSHLGMKPDRQLAQKFAGEIDVIIGGHSHTVTEQPRIEGGTLIVQTGAYGISLGVLELYIEDGNVASNSFELIPITEDMPSDPGIDSLIEEHLVLGEVTGAPLTWSDQQQSPLGSLMADSMRWLTEADAALVQSSVAQGVLDQGVITANEFFEVFWPYRARTMGPEKDLDEEQLIALKAKSPELPLWAIAASSDKLESIVVLELTGKELSDVLEKSQGQKGSEYFLQLSGDILSTENLPRLAGDEATYRVAVNLSLALGEGEYGLFDKLDTFELTKVEVFEAVIGFLREQKTVSVGTK